MLDSNQFAWRLHFYPSLFFHPFSLCFVTFEIVAADVSAAESLRQKQRGSGEKQQSALDVDHGDL